MPRTRLRWPRAGLSHRLVCGIPLPGGLTLLINPIQPHAVSEEFPPHVVRQRHGKNLFHGAQKLAVDRVRVCRNKAHKGLPRL